jgi:PKD repeat protein
MPDQPPSVDGVTQQPAADPLAPPPAAPKQPRAALPPAAKRMKGAIIVLVAIVTALYLAWGGVLLALLPSQTGDLKELESVGVLSALVAGIFYVAVGGIGFMRVKEADASAASKQFALLKLFLVVVPGIAMSAALPLLITREPTLALTIVSPTAGAEMIAPLTITFSAESAIEVAKKSSGFSPIKFQWDLNGDKQFDQETVEPRLSATFERAGVFVVSAVMSNASGAKKTVSRRFIIQRSVFSVTPNPVVIERPAVFSVAHLNDKTNPITGIEWDFDGDGKTDEKTTATEVTHTYYRLGTVNVSALVSLTNKTQSRLERSVDVTEPAPLPFPVEIRSEPSYLMSPAPFPTLFRVETAEKVAQVQWDFGDGAKAEGARVAHTFEKKGNYPVVAKVSSASGTTAEITVVVRVVDSLNLPDLSFEGTPDVAGGRISEEVPVTLNLKPRTNVPFVKFLWEAPDATEVGSTETILQAIYRREGNYTVTLIAQDSQDRVLRMPISVEVKPAKSSLSIVMNPETGVAPLDVQFDASETFIPGETITGFEWEYGDRSAPQFGGARARHTFNDAGTYVVGLVVRTTSGKEFKTTKTLVVRAPVLSACIEPSRTSGNAPMGVGFGMGCSTGTISKVLWDFGDDSQSDERAPVHVFENPGVFKVQLTVEDAGGRKATGTTTITVR